MLLDVIVTDHSGKFVPGLKASDFTILEDNKPQTLSAFAAQCDVVTLEFENIPAATIAHIATHSSGHTEAIVTDDLTAARRFTAQVDSLGHGTTLLVDTYDIAEAVRAAVDIAGPELGAVRIDSGAKFAFSRKCPIG